MRDKRLRYIYGYIFLGFAIAFLLVLNLYMGSTDMSVKDIMKLLISGDTSSVDGKIIWSIRIPRLVSAALLGGALTVSGFLLQTFFSNPIAGPYVLGISSGAKLTVALSMIFLLQRGMVAGSVVMIGAAFIGSLISMMFILIISKRVNNMSVLIICGVMIGYICSAITDFLITFADDSNIINLHNWALGSFSGSSWSNVKVITVVVATAMFFAVWLSKPMSAYQLGETYARNMGVNIKKFRIALILLSSMLSSVVTAFAGPISFVGIAVPHLIRRLFKTSKPIHMIPACFMGGAAFCLLCDLIARVMFAPTEINISSVTAVFGAPVVIYIMIGRQRDRAE
jgi:iron complex transport system permease protein